MFFYNTGTETPDTWAFLVVGNQPIERLAFKNKKPRFFGLLWTVADNMTSTFFGHPFNHHQNTLRNQDFGQIVYIHTWILEVFDLWTLIAAALSAHVDKSRAELCFLHFSGPTQDFQTAFGSSRSSLLSSTGHFSGSAMPFLCWEEDS